MPEPVKIDQDTDTRIVIENRDGVLVARVQRVWGGEWTDWSEASGGDGTFHIRPAGTPPESPEPKRAYCAVHGCVHTFGGYCIEPPANA